MKRSECLWAVLLTLMVVCASNPSLSSDRTPTLTPPSDAQWVTTTPEIGVVNEVHDGGPHSDEEEHEHSDETRPAAWESWLYAMLSVALCAVVSLAGGLMMICGRAGIRHLMNLLGLAVGTLLGSALLSIFPETNATIGFGLGPCTVVLAGIMFGLLSEVFIHNHEAHASRTADRPPKLVAVHKSAPSSERGLVDRNHCSSLPIGASAGTQMVVIHGEVEGGLLVPISENPEPVPTADASATQQSTCHSETKVESSLENACAVPPDPAAAPATTGKTRLMLINLVGDALHNLVDGALIGATFLVSTRTGASVALAVAVHELPQELGDFAVLLHAGLSVRRALLLNFCVSLTSFLGAIIALVVGESFESVTPYILPFAGGMFLYLALACLIPEILTGHAHEQHDALQDRHHPLQTRASVRLVVSILVGIGLMALLLLVPGDHHH